MRTYYRGYDAMVTDELFVGRAPSTKSYAICELRNVHIASDAEPSTWSRPLTAAATGFLGLLGAVVGIAADSLSAVVVLALATPTAVAAVLVWPRRRTQWELRARHRGRLVCLYATCDATVFNQVTRALRRAIEAGAEPPTFTGEPAA